MNIKLIELGLRALDFVTNKAINNKTGKATDRTKLLAGLGVGLGVDMLTTAQVGTYITGIISEWGITWLADKPITTELITYGVIVVVTYLLPASKEVTEK